MEIHLLTPGETEREAKTAFFLLQMTLSMSEDPEVVWVEVVLLAKPHQARDPVQVAHPDSLKQCDQEY